jgi:hypothetical protein
MSAYSYSRQDFVNLTLARISLDFFPKSGLCCWTVETTEAQEKLLDWGAQSTAPEWARAKE